MPPSTMYRSQAIDVYMGVSWTAMVLCNVFKNLCPDLTVYFYGRIVY